MFLDGAALARAQDKRRLHNRLGWSIQWRTVRMLGTFLTDSDPAGVPEAVIRYVAGQLGMECGRDCFGLDQCQARLYTAILRHAVLVVAALAICAVTAALLKTVPIPGPRPRSPLIRPRRPDQA